MKAEKKTYVAFFRSFFGIQEKPFVMSASSDRQAKVQTTRHIDGKAHCEAITLYAIEGCCGVRVVASRKFRINTWAKWSDGEEAVVTPPKLVVAATSYRIDPPGTLENLCKEMSPPIPDGKTKYVAFFRVGEPFVMSASSDRQAKVKLARHTGGKTHYEAITIYAIENRTVVRVVGSRELYNSSRKTRYWKDWSNGKAVVAVHRSTVLETVEGA